MAGSFYSLGTRDVILQCRPLQASRGGRRMRLLELPAELLILILEQLEYSALLKMACTCRGLRDLIQPNHIHWLSKNFTRYYHRRDRYLEEACSLALSHAMVQIVHRHGFSRDLNLLTRRGANFRTSSAQVLLRRTFLRFGPGKKVDFMLQHGARFDTGPGGMDHILEETFRLYKVSSSRFKYLLQKGFWFKDIAVSLGELLALGLPPSHDKVQYLMDNGANVTQVPQGINRMLQSALYFNGWPRILHALETAHFLLDHGASVHNLPNGPERVLEDMFNIRANGTHRIGAIDLMLQNGVSLQSIPSGPVKLLEKFLRPWFQRDWVLRLEGYGVSVSDYPGGVNRLLQDIIESDGLDNYDAIDFLLFERGAKHVPMLNRVLEDHIQLKGIDYAASRFISLDRGESLMQVPSGIDKMVSTLSTMVANHIRCSQVGQHVYYIFYLMRHGARVDESHLPRVLAGAFLRDVCMEDISWVIDRYPTALTHIDLGELLKRTLSLHGSCDKVTWLEAQVTCADRTSSTFVIDNGPATKKIVLGKGKRCPGKPSE